MSIDSVLFQFAEEKSAKQFVLHLSVPLKKLKETQFSPQSEALEKKNCNLIKNHYNVSFSLSLPP